MDRKEVEIISHNQKMIGTLFTPDNPAGPLPAVVFFHGRGSSQKRYLPRAEKLAERGFVTLAFDFRGCGGSDGEFGKLTLEDGITDAITAYDFLLKQPHVDVNRVGINGGSYGGYLAAIISAKRIVPALVLDAPAAYKDEWLQVGYEDIPIAEVGTFRKDGDIAGTLSFSCIKLYTGNLLVIRHEKDEVIPPIVVESYVLYAKTKRKEMIVLPGAIHRLEGESYEKASELTVEWFINSL